MTGDDFFVDERFHAVIYLHSPMHRSLSMKDFIKVMKALSDPNRVKILKMLQHQSLCVCEMQAVLDIAQPTVSSHLRLLEDAGLVHSRKNGLWVSYFISDGSRSPYVASLLGNLKHWLKDEPEISRLIASLSDLNRENIMRRQSA
jgi:ArsR family transcriptional regulator